jgi:hypothetical protein
MESRQHPVVRAAVALETALKGVSDADPTFMRTAEKRVALLRWTGRRRDSTS